MLIICRTPTDSALRLGSVQEYVLAKMIEAWSDGIKVPETAITWLYTKRWEWKLSFRRVEDRFIPAMRILASRQERLMRPALGHIDETQFTDATKFDNLLSVLEIECSA
jgi:hypothetical protein